VHLKGSLVSKMPGDVWQKLANLRLLLCYQMLNPGKKLLFMGGEFGQWREWDERSQLDWSLCDNAGHRGVQLMARDLNMLYRQQLPLHRYEFENSGFEWLDCNDCQQSVLSFMRQADGEQLICVFNFTPVVRLDYRIGLPRAGRYQEIFNSDSSTYGGSNVGNAGWIDGKNVSWMGRPASTCITLPPLAALVLRLQE
jgi:1,4-alpha-glucan branching enzyme